VKEERVSHSPPPTPPHPTPRQVVVETSDHARLSLKLSYSWRFEARDDRIFQVPDFVGGACLCVVAAASCLTHTHADMCKAAASMIRGTVAQTRFEVFHKESARIIRSSVVRVGESCALSCAPISRPPPSVWHH
jgi:major vault protein